MRDKGLADFVKKRDYYMCQCCYRIDEALEAHHIQPLASGGKDVENNMITLCKQCHANVPEDANDFLSYQKSGGIVWINQIGNLAIISANKINKNMSMEKLLAVISYQRDKTFGLSIQEIKSREQL